MSVLSACTCVIYTLGLLHAAYPPPRTPPSSKPAIAAKPAEKACGGFLHSTGSKNQWATRGWLQRLQPTAGYQLGTITYPNPTVKKGSSFETHQLQSVPAIVGDIMLVSEGRVSVHLSSLHLGITKWLRLPKKTHTASSACRRDGIWTRAENDGLNFFQVTRVTTVFQAWARHLVWAKIGSYMYCSYHLEKGVQMRIPCTLTWSYLGKLQVLGRSKSELYTFFCRSFLWSIKRIYYIYIQYITYLHVVPSTPTIIPWSTHIQILEFPWEAKQVSSRALPPQRPVVRCCWCFRNPGMQGKPYK